MIDVNFNFPPFLGWFPTLRGVVQPRRLKGLPFKSVAVWCWPGHGLVNSLHVYGRFDPCHLTPGLPGGFVEGFFSGLDGFRRYFLLADLSFDSPESYFGSLIVGFEVGCVL